MNLPLKLRSLAARDIGQAIGWHEEQREGLGDRLLEEIRQTMTKIAALPGYPPCSHKSV